MPKTNLEILAPVFVNAWFEIEPELADSCHKDDLIKELAKGDSSSLNTLWDTYVKATWEELEDLATTDESDSIEEIMDNFQVAMSRAKDDIDSLVHHMGKNL